MFDRSTIAQTDIYYEGVIIVPNVAKFYSILERITGNAAYEFCPNDGMVHYGTRFQILISGGIVEPIPILRDI